MVKPLHITPEQRVTILPYALRYLDASRQVSQGADQIKDVSEFLRLESVRERNLGAIARYLGISQDGLTPLTREQWEKAVEAVKTVEVAIKVIQMRQEVLGA